MHRDREPQAVRFFHRGPRFGRREEGLPDLARTAVQGTGQVELDELRPARVVGAHGVADLDLPPKRRAAEPVRLWSADPAGGADEPRSGDGACLLESAYLDVEEVELR